MTSEEIHKKEQAAMESIRVFIDGRWQRLLTGRMSYMIGNFKVDRHVYWLMTDEERQALHDKHDPGSKAIPFDPRFAEKYGKNPEGPF